MKVVTIICASLLTCAVFAEKPAVDDFRNFEKKNWKTFQSGKVEKTEDGVRIETSKAGAGGATLYLRQNWRKRSDWDRKYNGVAFKVKGCGSDDYSSISLVVDYSLHLRWYFPLKNTDWQEYRVHFSDFTPANRFALQISSSPGNLPISALRGIAFGDDWKITHNNAKRKPLSFEITDFRLITDAQSRFELGKYQPASLDSFKKRMKAGEKVKILSLGDSITAGSGLRPADGTRWADVTGQLLREKYGFQGVTTKSFAVGGAHSWDVVAWLNRDFEEIPDLVTFMCGYNDFSCGMHPEVYRYFLTLLISRITALSQGKTAIVLFTPIPGCGPRYNAHDLYAQTVREVAGKYGVACFDLNAVFKKAFTVQTIGGSFNDMAHPNKAGHRLIAEKLAEFLSK